MEEFTKTFDQYSRQLLGFAYKYCRDSELAADLVQESFTRLWERKSSIKSSSNYKKYLFTTVLHLSYDHTAKKNRMQETSLCNLQQSGFSIHDERINVVNDLALQEILSLTEQTINALPPRDRAVFILKQYINLNYQEIAEIIGESSRNIKRRVRKILDKLFIELDKKGIKKEAISIWLLW